MSGERINPLNQRGYSGYNYWLHVARYDFVRPYATGKRVLDIGCGTGYGSHYLAEVASRVEAIDLVDEALVFARKHFSRPNLTFYQASATQLPFPNASFDVVSCLEVLEHLPVADAERLLREVTRLLRQDGAFIVSTPNGVLTSHDREHPDNHFHEREYTIDEFQRLLERYFRQVTLYAQHPSEEALTRRAAYQTVDQRVDRALGTLITLDVFGLRRLIPKHWRETAATLMVDAFGQRVADQRSSTAETLDAFRVESKSRQALEKSLVFVAIAQAPFDHRQDR